MAECQYCQKVAYNWGKDEYLCFDHLTARLLVNMLVRRGMLVNAENARTLIAQFPRLADIESDLERLIADARKSPILS